jgi:hypothetical protein
MYRLLKDKNNEFLCEIKLEGASTKDAKVRLFLQGDGCEYSFNGIIEEGKCMVPLGKLKKFTNLLESGKIRLEVIADDTWFVPYESEYQLEQERKVTVEVFEPGSTQKKPLVEVKVQEPVPTPRLQAKPTVQVEKKNPIIEIKKYLKENTNFNGTPNSLKSVIQKREHKLYINTICESRKLDKLTVLKQMLN